MYLQFSQIKSQEYMTLQDFFIKQGITSKVAKERITCTTQETLSPSYSLGFFEDDDYYKTEELVKLAKEYNDIRDRHTSVAAFWREFVPYCDELRYNLKLENFRKIVKKKITGISFGRSALYSVGELRDLLYDYIRPLQTKESMERTPFQMSLYSLLRKKKNKKDNAILQRKYVTFEDLFNEFNNEFTLSSFKAFIKDVICYPDLNKLILTPKKDAVLSIASIAENIKLSPEDFYYSFYKFNKETGKKERCTNVVWDYRIDQDHYNSDKYCPLWLQSYLLKDNYSKRIVNKVVRNHISEYCFHPTKGGFGEIVIPVTICEAMEEEAKHLKEEEVVKRKNQEDETFMSIHEYFKNVTDHYKEVACDKTEGHFRNKVNELVKKGLMHKETLGRNNFYKKGELKIAYDQTGIPESYWNSDFSTLQSASSHDFGVSKSTWTTKDLHKLIGDYDESLKYIKKFVYRRKPLVRVIPILDLKEFHYYGTESYGQHFPDYECHFTFQSIKTHKKSNIIWDTLPEGYTSFGNLQEKMLCILCNKAYNPFKSHDYRDDFKKEDVLKNNKIIQEILSMYYSDIIVKPHAQSYRTLQFSVWIPQSIEEEILAKTKDELNKPTKKEQVRIKEKSNHNVIDLIEF